jgi:predicted phosphodiesterase
MRVAALYDIHGNVPALDAVLAEVEREQVDLIVIGGDVVPGPQPQSTIELLTALGPRARFVRGNGDREVVAAYDAGRVEPQEESNPTEQSAAFSAARITRSQRDLLAGFEPTIVLDVDELGAVVFCHGSPRSDTEMITTATPEGRLREIVAEVPEATVVGGHTHRQFDRRVPGHRVVNAGSVGSPYEGRAGAYWALIGPDVVLRRTEYDIAAASEQLLRTGYTGIDEALRESLTEPLDPDEVAAYLERLATGG